MSGSLARSIPACSLALALACAGTAAVRLSAVPAPCGGSLPSLDGERVQAHRFSLVVPAGFEERDVQGIDSCVGQWTDGRGGAIAYDYGAYSSDLSESRSMLVDLAECRDSIGGHLALILTDFDTDGTIHSTARRPQYVASAAWRDLREGVHLTVTVRAVTPKGFGARSRCCGRYDFSEQEALGPTREGTSPAPARRDPARGRDGAP